MKLHLVRVPNGYAFADGDSAKAAEKHRLGEKVRATVVKPRSGPFLRKYFALLQFAFDYWEPGDGEQPQEFRGVAIEKNFERFRKDVTILAGYFHPVWNAKGEMRVEADSIAFDSMEPEDFEKLYSASINVLIKLVMGAKGFSERALREAVDELVRFGDGA